MKSEKDRVTTGGIKMRRVPKKKGMGVDSEVLRNSPKMKASMMQFPRKKKGHFEKTAARATTRGKYRKDFKKIK